MDNEEKVEKQNYSGIITSVVIVIIVGLLIWWFISSQNTTITACDNPQIKGNISSSGEKIYHEPGQQFYDATVIDGGKGEKWFCTEEEAIDAGWRKSKK